ncbi:MAG: response regulator transcription factor [Pseudomonadota bacterium]
MENKNTIVIAESHEIIREVIARQIEDCCDFDKVETVGDGYGAIRLARSIKPEVVLLDLSLERPSGLETLSCIKKSCPDAKVIVLSPKPDFQVALNVFSKGAIGFMLKQAKGQDFVNAVSAALSGYSQLPVKFTSNFVKSRRNIGRSGNPFGLSPREMEVLDACVRGEKTKQIANSLNISVRTVDTHRNNIYRKTGSNSQQALIASASNWYAEIEG